ncbi:DUF930 domain-containing protein [Rhodobacterales bacterium]|nr:DUF930 domain-containing protein [Rhodobacterales bacterium]
MRGTSLKDNELYAPAAALRSKYVWYELAYRCRFDGEGVVTAFAYSMGAEIDRSLWDELGLAPIH